MPANLSPDLINVFKNAGHLLGLVSCGLKNGEVTLRMEPDKTCVFFTWRYKTDRGLLLNETFCMAFSELDYAGTAEYHAAIMLAEFNMPLSKRAISDLIGK